MKVKERVMLRFSAPSAGIAQIEHIFLIFSIFNFLNTVAPSVD